MAAVITIIIDNLQLKIQKSIRGLESIGQIFFIFYMTLTYNHDNSATKTHISNFQKIQHGRRYGNNFR